MELTEKAKRMDKKTALAKAENWCAYQERSHADIRNKLYSWGVYPNEIEEIISHLIAENFLNEERFAMAYVSGKFKIKRWGREKIKRGLRLKKVPDVIIRKALNTIDYDTYIETITTIAKNKHALIRETNPLKHKFKLISFLQSKGFESDLIFEVLNANNLY